MSNFNKSTIKMVWYKDTLKDILHYCKKFESTNFLLKNISLFIEIRLKGEYIDFEDISNGEIVNE